VQYLQNGGKMQRGGRLAADTATAAAPAVN
jgi:hypothetical protein